MVKDKGVYYDSYCYDANKKAQQLLRRPQSRPWKKPAKQANIFDEINTINNK